MRKLLALILVTILLLIGCASDDSDVNQNVTELEIEIEGLESSAISHKAKIAALEDDKKVLQEDMSVLEAEKIYKDGEIAELEGEVAELEKAASEVVPVECPTPNSCPSPDPCPTPTPCPTVESTLEPTSEPTPPEPVIGAIVQCDGLSLREGPGIEYDTIGNLSAMTNLYIDGQYNGCNWLKVVSESQVSGWVVGQNRCLKFVEPVKSCPAIPNGTYSPLTGILESSIQRYSGQGRLVLTNNSGLDVLVVLNAASSQGQFSGFIRDGGRLQIMGIDDGTYDIYMSSGSEWDGVANRFTQNPVYKAYFMGVTFVTTTTCNTNFAFTIDLGPDGTIYGQELTADQFPDILN